MTGTVLGVGDVMGTNQKTSFCLDEAASPMKVMDIDQSHNKSLSKTVMCVSKRKGTGCPESGLQRSLSRGDSATQIEIGSSISQTQRGGKGILSQRSSICTGAREGRGVVWKGD